MNDTTSTTTVTTAPAPVAQTDVIKPLSDDAVQAIKDIKAIIASFKSGGIGAATAQAATLIPDIEKDYSDIKAALPTVQAGYKTSFFWITVVVDAMLGWFTYKGTVPPLDGAVTIAALSAVYGVVRGIIATTHSTNVTAVATTPVAVTTTTVTK